MSETQIRSALRPVAQTLLGGLIVLLSVPTGFGAVAGGWVASRETQSQHRGTVASAVAGLLGALPWTTLTFLAARGTIEPIGYHEGVVHVGVQTASPEALVLWQEVGLAVLLAVTITTFAIAGGFISGLLDGSVLTDWRDPA